MLTQLGAAHLQGLLGGSTRLQALRWPLKVVAYITDSVAFGRILDHLDLSPSEKPPPDFRGVVRVAADDEGREIAANRA